MGVLQTKWGFLSISNITNTLAAAAQPKIIESFADSKQVNIISIYSLFFSICKEKKKVYFKEEKKRILEINKENL